ncbi:MAG: Gfo/Idh/MocA family oxidoreductase [Oscillospiraceae bacterium]|nr:Gfo/Idh/MocA family oxidoreductase [Oscillospiraceae bacterium]MCL2278541.1 Gfo/Idh/MocA family oxidoreductase [Oscillospiraceae bacterium]
MKTLKAIVIGAGQRGNAYCNEASELEGVMQIVGVAEPDNVRRAEFQSKYGLKGSVCLSTWEDVFTREKWADAVIICTQDNMHYKPAMAAIERGYDILLEKPIAPTAQECLDIAEAAHKKGVKIVVCHVLRYSAMFKTVKEIIECGEIGDIVTVVHNENVGNTHHAHSYVRGKWAKAKESSPMILAKSCHDLDILQWLINKKCLRLSSFGSLAYFTKENCPKGAPARCTDGCKIANCPYDSRYLYYEGDLGWTRETAAGHANPTDDEVTKALKVGPYGRCVYQCDNDVVDHQVVSMEFEDGVTAIFSMSAFTPEISRSIKIMGTKGQIKAHQDSDTIIVSDFSSCKDKIYSSKYEGGHGGGDKGIVATFCRYIRGDDNIPEISEIGISSANHLLCFAAEKSRLSGGKVVEMEGFN